MPNYIDQKVVEMQFDNDQFQKGVAESLKSLEALKKGLELDKSANSLANLEKVANEVDFSGLTKNIDSIADHFTVVGRFIDRHIDGLIDKAVGGTKRFIASITTDQIVKGQKKFEQYSKAVQMIRSALPNETMETIESTLSKLNEYTDATSYDFAEMAQTIGKFTSKGIGLKDAELAMEGIANWSAAAGGEIQQANIAMYNLAQALGAGAVKKLDWRSIQTANMDTKEFKEQVIQTAVAMGILGNAGNNAGILVEKTSKGVKQTVVNYQNFEETLAKGWFNRDVLMAVLTEYADQESEVGKKGFLAAREAITLTQAIDAVKDAVSTGWMNSFKLIFGNLEESTKLFTNFSDALIDFLAPFDEWRNSVLEGWHGDGLADELSGYSMAIDAASDAWQAFCGIVETVKEALTDVFPPVTGERLTEMTSNIRDFTGYLRETFAINDEEITVRADIETDGIKEWEEFLNIGAEGKEVKTLQKRLIELGYSVGEAGADGIFGKKTQTALMDFQNAIGVAQDGVYGLQEKKAFAQQLIPISADYYGSIELGSRGEEVKKLQNRLQELGYDLGESGADGIFGKKTQAALKAFQKDIGVVEDGVYGLEERQGIEHALFPQGVKQFEETTETVRKVPSALENIKKILKGVFSVFSIGGKVVGFVVNLVKTGLYLLAPLGSALLTVLGVIGDCFTNLNQGLEVLDPFNKAIEWLQNVISNQLADFFDGLGNAVSFFLGAVGEAPTFLGTLIALFETVKQTKFGEFIIGIWNTVSSVFGIAGGTVSKFVKDLGEVFGMFGYVLSHLLRTNPQIKTFEDIWVRFAYMFSNMNNTMGKSLGKFMYDLDAKFKKVIPVIKNTGKTIKNFFGNAFKTILTVAAVAVGGLVFGVIGLVKAIWNAGKAVANFVKTNQTLQNVWTKIKDTAKKVGGFFEDLGKAIGKVFSSKSDKKMTGFTAILGNIIKALMGSKNKAVAKFGTALKDLLHWIGATKISLTDFGQKVKEWLSERFKTAVEWISTNVPKAWASIKKFFTDAYNSVTKSNFIQNTLGGIKEKFQQIVPNVISALKDIGGAIHDFFFGKNTSGEKKTFKERFESVKKTISNVFTGAKEAISDAVGKISGWFQEIYDNSTILQSANELVTPFLDNVKELAKLFGQGVVGFFTTDTSNAESPEEALQMRLAAFDPLVEKVNQIKDDVTKSLKELAKTIKDKLKEIYDNSQILQDIYGFLNPILTEIKNIWNAFKSSVVDFFTMDISEEEGSEFDKLMKRFSAFESFTDQLAQTKDKLLASWNSLTGKNGDFQPSENGKSVLSVITDFFGKFKNQLPKLIGPAIAAVVAYSVFNAASFLKNLSGGLSNFAKGYAAKRGVGFDTLGDTVLKIGGAIALISLALLLLEQVDANKVEPAVNKFTQVVATIVGAFGAKGAIMLAFKKAGVTFGAKSGIEIISGAIRDIGIGVVAAAAGILILVDAYKEMDENLKELGNKVEVDKNGNTVVTKPTATVWSKLGALAVIGAMLFAIYQFEKGIVKAGLPSVKGLKDGLGSGGGMALAVVSAAESVKILVDAYVKMNDALKGLRFKDVKDSNGNVINEKNWAQYAGAFVAIGAFLWELGEIEKGLAANFGPGKFGSGIASDIGIYVLARSVRMLVNAYKVMSDAIAAAPPDSDNALGAFAAIEAFLFSLAGSQELMSLSKASFATTLGNDAGIYILAEAVKTVSTAYGDLVKATKYVSAENISNVANGITLIFGALGTLAVLMGELGGAAVVGDLGLAALFTAFGTGMEVIGAAIGDSTGPIFQLGVVIEDFNSMLEDVDPNRIKSATDALHDMVAFMTTDAVLVSVGASEGFRNEIEKLGASIELFSSSMSGSDLADLDKAEKYVANAKRVIEEAAALDSSGQLNPAVDNLDAIGSALDLYYNSIAGINLNNGGATKEQIEAAFTGLSEGIPENTTLKKIAGYASNAEGVDMLKVATGIQRIGSALRSYGNHVGTLNETKVETGNKIIEAIGGLNQRLNSTNPFWSLVSTVVQKKSALSNFAEDVTLLGDAIGNYGTSITGKVNESDVKIANSIMNGIASVKLPKNGFMSLVTGQQTLGQFAANMSAIGEGLNRFATKATENNVSYNNQTITDALAIIDTLVGYGERLENVEQQRFSILADDMDYFFDRISKLDVKSTYGSGKNKITETPIELAKQALEDMKVVFEEGLPKIYKLSESMMSNFSLGIKTGKSKALNAVAEIMTNIVKLLGLYDSNFVNIGHQLDYGLARGIREKSYYPSDAFAWVVRKAYISGMQAADIRSPSRVTAWMGEMMDQGLVNGLLSYAGRVESASESVVQSAIDTAEAGLRIISDIISSDVDTTPVIRPVIDMTDIEDGASTLGGMFGSRTIGVGSANLAYRVSAIDNQRGYTAARVTETSIGLGGTIESLNARIDELGQKISNMQVVLDNGVLVGEISSDIDRSLGKRQTRAKRGGV